MTIERTGLAAGLPGGAPTLEIEILRDIRQVIADTVGEREQVRYRAILLSVAYSLRQSDFIVDPANFETPDVFASDLMILAKALDWFIDKSTPSEDAIESFTIDAIEEIFAAPQDDNDGLDAADRIRRRRRRMISALVHRFRPSDYLSEKKEPTSRDKAIKELISAIMNLDIDFDQLEKGLGAELILAPNAIQPDEQSAMSYRKKVVLGWLAVLHCYRRSSSMFRSQRALREFASECLGGISAASLKTELSNIRKASKEHAKTKDDISVRGYSRTDTAYWGRLCEIAHRAGPEAASIVMPSAYGLSIVGIPKHGSAGRTG